MFGGATRQRSMIRMFKFIRQFFCKHDIVDRESRAKPKGFLECLKCGKDDFDKSICPFGNKTKNYKHLEKCEECEGDKNNG